MEGGVDMACKEHRDRCTYVVLMEGVDGTIYETECDTPEEAVRLEVHHRNLGWYAWIELKPKIS